MSYAVKEIFYTLQGEGANAGQAAVFCRFSGCNLWSGREEDRDTAVCRFCDTDFVGSDGPGGGRFDTASGLAAAIARQWPSGEGRSGPSRPWVIFTGGEPLLQLDEGLVQAVRERGFVAGIETNGTLLPPPGIDWICVSPKAGTVLRLISGDELKLVFPQEGVSPPQFEHLDFRHFFLQPMDGPEREQNTQRAVEYCLRHPQWRISLQTQKILGIA